MKTVRKFNEFINEENVNEKSNVRTELIMLKSSVDTIGEEAENMKPGKKQDMVFQALDDIEAAMSVINDNM